MLEESLRILQINTFDIHGGAEKVAWDLFSAYRARGYYSRLAVGEKRSNDPDVLTIPNQQLRGRWYDFLKRISKRLQRVDANARTETPLSLMASVIAEPVRAFDLLRGHEDFNFPGTSNLLTLTPQPPHIVHCHNLHGGYFDLRLLPYLSQQLPVVLTLHDAWLLSGHCAHSFGCERWKTGCGHCPDLAIYPAIRRDATGYNWQRKRGIYARSQLYVATPSWWLMKKVEESMLVPAVVEARVIPNGVDLSIFQPADKLAARAGLNLPQKAKVLLTTGIMIHKNIWKDYSTLRHAITLVKDEFSEQDLLLIVLGEDAPPERTDGLEVRYIPYEKDPRVVARYYQAADIYVHAVQADTFPTSVIEAMACGKPVVATAIGGIPEQIEDTYTGFLVPKGDAPGLAARVTQILSDDRLKVDIGMQAAKSARYRFGFDRQVEAYLSWYDELLRGRTGMISTGKSYALSNPG